jgi:general secretion pathway protein G
MNMHSKNRGQRGFTLIEIMVVVVIIAVLATLIIPNVIGRAEDARVAKAKADVRALDSALAMYRLDNGHDPSTDQGLQALVKKPTGSPSADNWRKGGYVRSLPDDPWGHSYQYLSPGQHGNYDLWSSGPDGISGNADDIRSWNLK